MSKRVDSIIILFIICGLLALILTAKKGQKYNDSLINQVMAEHIVTGRVKDSELVNEVWFGDERLMFDISSNTFFYSLMGDELSVSNPVIKALSADDRLNISVISDSDSQDVKLLIYDDKNYTISNLVVTTLPLMSITCSSDIEYEDIPAYMELVDNRGGAEKKYISSDATIRVRGGTTTSYPKKPYKLTLKANSLGNHIRKNDISLLGMRKDDDWVLYAAYNDQEKVRNVFSQNLWSYSCGKDNEYNIDTGLQYRYIELFINDRYMGLYALGYTPDEKRLGLNKSKVEGLYKRYNITLDRFVVENSEADLNPSKMTEYIRNVYDYFFNLQDSCHDSEYLKKAVDIDNNIDFFLYIWLIQGTDNLHKNYYMMLKNDGDAYKSIYIPWDMDITWGNRWIDSEQDNLTDCYYYNESQNFLFSDGYLYWLFYNGDEEIKSKIIEKYEKLRSDVWSDKSINLIIDEYEREIFGSGAYIRDKNRWPSGNYLSSNEGYSLAKFRKYVLNRLGWMDEYINRLKMNDYVNPFIQQTILFKDIENSYFLVRVKNRSVLEKEDYKELLEYLGINLSDINFESGYIVYDKHTGSQQVVSEDMDLVNGVETICGLLSTGRTDYNIYDEDDEYTVFLDDLACIDVMHDALPIDIAVISKEGFVQSMNLNSDYRAMFSMYAINDPALMVQALAYTSGKKLVLLDTRDQAINLDFLSKYELELGRYKNIQEAVAEEDKLVLLLRCEDRVAVVINEGLSTGTSCETELGTYFFYEGEGIYGIYYNGEEVIVDSAENLYKEPIMIFDL